MSWQPDGWQPDGQQPDGWHADGSISDTVPSAFQLVAQTNVATNTLITSAGTTIAGINVTVTFTATGGTIDVNGDGDFQTSRDVVVGDVIRAQHTSSGRYLGVTSTVVTGGGVSSTFTSTARDTPATRSRLVIVGGNRRTIH